MTTSSFPIFAETSALHAAHARSFCPTPSSPPFYVAILHRQHFTGFEVNRQWGTMMPPYTCEPLIWLLSRATPFLVVSAVLSESWG